MTKPTQTKTATACQKTPDWTPERIQKAIRQTKELDQPQAQHSPLPWSFAAINEDLSIMTKVDGKRIEVATVTLSSHPAGQRFDIANANKELIVRSVNNAEALAEALRDLCDNGGSIKTWKAANEALARWEGK